MKKFDLQYNYDIESDTLEASIKDSYQYAHSIKANRMNFDLNFKGEIIGFEISEASVKFKIEKKKLERPEIEVMIHTTCDLVKIYVVADFENRERRFLKEKIPNECNSPIGIRQLNYR